MALRRTLVALLLVLLHTSGWALPAPLVSFSHLCDEVLAWDEMAAYDEQLGKKAQEIQAKTGSIAQQASARRYKKVSNIITSEKQQRLVYITLEGGKSLTATDGQQHHTLWLRQQ